MSSAPPAAQARPVRRALVLSGGGGRGAFQCGVIEELDRNGWQPDMLVGTSIGSHNAALWATGGAARVTRFWDEVETRRMHRFMRLWPWGSLLDRTPWERTLRAVLPADELAATAAPLYLVATNITTGQLVIFTNHRDLDSEKPLYKKVRLGYEHLLASSAIPLFYAPIKINHESHWDGAVMYNSPLAPAIDAGASEVVAVLLSPFGAAPPPPRGLGGRLGLVLDLAITATFTNDYGQLNRINQQVGERRARPGHREVRCTVVAPPKWLPPLDIVRYNRREIALLRQLGRDAVRAAFADGRIAARSARP